MRREYTLEEKLEALFVISLFIGVVATAVWVAMLVVGVLDLSSLGRFL